MQSGSTEIERDHVLVLCDEKLRNHYTPIVAESELEVFFVHDIDQLLNDCILAPPLALIVDQAIAEEVSETKAKESRYDCVKLTQR